MAKKMLIFCGSDDPYKAFPPFILASGALAMDMEITLFFTLTGLNIVKKGIAETIMKELGEFTPFVGILFLSTVILLLFVMLGQVILILSVAIVIPAIIGYTLGKKKTLFASSPRIFLAQPDRQDPNHTRCRFLSPQNYCNVTGKVDMYFPNICDNKWNQATCSFYLRQISFERKTQKYQKGDYINEIQ